VVENLNDYIDNRIAELTKTKTEIFKSFETITKTIEELSLIEEKQILENKMRYYMVMGALAELNELKKALNIE